jgi:uncharacterized surface protein with fasciclin (FAS1) repeats
MKIFFRIKNSMLLLMAGAVFFSACNKLELDPVPAQQPTQETTPTLGSMLDDPNYSLLKAAVTKAGLLPALSNPSARFTLFAPDDAAITASLTPILPTGVTPAMYIASLTQPQAAGLIQYHVLPQVVKAATINTGFPNFQYPTLLNPAPSVSALLRLTSFPSVRTGVGAWVNNVPIIGTDIPAVNGVMHKVFRIVMPPSVDLWSKIQSETDLAYLRAAIARADSGVAAGARLQDALNTAVNPSAIGANLTVFAPTDAAMQAFLTGAITQALVGQGFPLATAQAVAGGLVGAFGPTIISNPASIPDVPPIPPGTNIGARLAAVLTPTLAKGIVAYHILSAQSGTYAPPGLRVFSVNLPSSATTVKTLLNSAVAVHPGVTVQASFASPFPGISVVTSATVKGAANATASAVTSADNHCVNGVIHKIDQVLLPQ